MMAGINYLMTILLKSWLIANQYFSGIPYMRSVPSHGIQTVISSAFHGILFFWLLCLHVDSKNVSFLSRFLLLKSLCNKPFGSIRLLRAFTGLTVPGQSLMEFPPPRTWPRTPLQPPMTVSPTALWQQKVVVVRDHFAFSSLCAIVSVEGMTT